MCRTVFFEDFIVRWGLGVLSSSYSKQLQCAMCRVHIVPCSVLSVRSPCAVHLFGVQKVHCTLKITVIFLTRGTTHLVLSFCALTFDSFQFQREKDLSLTASGLDHVP